MKELIIFLDKIIPELAGDTAAQILSLFWIIFCIIIWMTVIQKIIYIFLQQRKLYKELKTIKKDITFKQFLKAQEKVNYLQKTKKFEILYELSNKEGEDQ